MSDDGALVKALHALTRDPLTLTNRYAHFPQRSQLPIASS